MGGTVPVDPWGFTKHRRLDPPRRPVDERVLDWDVVYRRPDPAAVAVQARRCMACGVPFCHGGCPLGNLIPDWNELVVDQRWREAIDQLHATNNFPEFTGWLCPAPCEAACVLAINDDPVSIKQIELAIIDRAWDRGWVHPLPPDRHSGRTVAVVGSGPAGLAAAQQLTRAGHTVAVYERSDALGGLLRYGIPDFKMPKGHIDRRLAQMAEEGTAFHAGVDVGSPALPVVRLRSRYDAVVLAVGALRSREIDCPGRHLAGVVQGMDYLPAVNRVVAGRGGPPPVDARGRHVVVIGGGDTAADCLGTANRQGAASVTVVDHNPAPPAERDELVNPWPQWPRTHHGSPAHEEGVRERWAEEVVEFVGEDRVRAVCVRQVRERVVDGRRVFVPVPGTRRELPADLVLLAAGFVGTGAEELLGGLWVDVVGERATVAIDEDWATGTEGVWACGDATRGASLVVWAIADGRACAAAVDRSLGGPVARLPAPVRPHDRPL